MAQPNRPLSPHVGIYRWQISNALSIVHRMTGVLLSAGALVLTAWLGALAAGPNAYRELQAVLSSLPGLALLAGWSFCFFYHLGNGVRHLTWDAGYGFGKSVARRSGVAVVIFAVVVTCAFWLLALSGSGGVR
jgi:succinate dehydrogenase / fumarate reductase cytochrome b subunit